MPNFFDDNRDLKFTLENPELGEVARLTEDDFRFAEKYDTAPKDFADALDNYRRVLDIVGGISGDRIEPRSRTVDAEGPSFENGKVTYHPLTVQNLNDLKQAGLMGVMLEHRFGGLNFPVSVYTMMTEMVSRADASLQNIFGLQDIAETISFFGSDEQKERYLYDFAAGKLDGAMDLTEADYGSDLQSVRLRAWQDAEGNWFLNGTKRFITNGCAAVHLVLARSEEGTSDGRGLSMFICEKCPQLVVRRIENKLGIHGVATAELQFNDVPAQLCGKRRFGLIKYVMSLMNGARVAISAQAVGIAEAAYREARKYASERMQFKRAIDTFPAVYDMLADMKLRLTASRALLYETTRAVDLRNSYTKLAESENVTDEVRAMKKYYDRVAAVLTPMCKALSTESANRIAYDGIQIHGGSGYMRDFNAERFYRDARITNIYEGTTQLQVIAAIGGVMQRDNDRRIAELAGLDYTGTAAELRDKIMEMHGRMLRAVAYVADMKDAEYHDLVARELVGMETVIFTGLLLLRDSLRDAGRLSLAERWITGGGLDFDRGFAKVMSGDRTLIDNNRKIIQY